MAFSDSMDICKFSAFAESADHYAQQYAAFTGQPFTADDVLVAGERIYNLERHYNNRAGFRDGTDTLPDRFLNELVDYRNDQYDISDVYWVSTHDNRSAGVLVSSSYFPGENGVSNFGLQVRWDESRRQADSGYDWFVNRTATTWVFAEHERNIARNLILRGGLSGLLLSYDSWNSTTSSVNPSLHLEWLFLGNTITGSVSRVSRFPSISTAPSRAQ